MSPASNAGSGTTGGGTSPDTVDIRIEHDISTAIFEQRMPPGTRLSEARLGSLYDVSRTIARKALFRLASDRLVEIRPNRGAIVPRPSVVEARQVFEARRVVESAMLADSMPRMTSDDHAALDTLVAEDRAAHAARDRQRMIRASGDFHRGLARFSTNDVLFHFVEQLIGRTSLIIATYQSHALPSCSEHAHQHLIDTIRSGDIPAAQQAMTAHLLDCENQLDLVDTAPDDTADLARMLGTPRTR